MNKLKLNAMKNLLSLFIVMLVSSLVLVSCDKDDDPKPTVKYLKAISYSPNKKELAKKTAYAGPVAKFTDAKAKVKFAVKTITKDKKAFTNPATGIKIDAATGKLSLAATNTLENGVYVVTVECTDQNNKKIKKTATFTITIK